MNKWILLMATLLVTLAFAITIQTTIANPVQNNLLISGGLFVIMGIGIWLFFKAGNVKTTKVGNEEFVPLD